MIYKLAAVILAAGLSSRMRDFKPLLKLGGKTIIKHVLDTVRTAGTETVVVVTGYRAAEIEAHLRDESVIFAQNENYATTQMLDSLLIGLAKIPQKFDRVIITPADIPAVKPETIKLLLSSGGLFVRPTHKGKNGHPAIMSAKLIPALFDYSGNEGLRGAVQAAGAELTGIEVPDRGVLLDADTPEDYAGLRDYFALEFEGE